MNSPEPDFQVPEDLAHFTPTQCINELNRRQQAGEEINDDTLRWALRQMRQLRKANTTANVKKAAVKKAAAAPIDLNDLFK